MFSTECKFVTIEVITMDRLDFNGKTFELTRGHVYEGIRKDGSGCPLALALGDFLFDMDIEEPEINVDKKTAFVEYDTMTEDSDCCVHHLVLDDVVSDFVRDFDDELIAYKEFGGRTVRIELLEDQHYKLSFV